MMWRILAPVKKRRSMCQLVTAGVTLEHSVEDLGKSMCSSYDDQRINQCVTEANISGDIGNDPKFYDVGARP